MSTETTSLADLYDNQPLEKPEPQGQADPAPQQSRTGEGQAASAPAQQQAPQDTPPVSDGRPPNGFAPVAALEDERRKRQRLERDFQELQRRVSQPAPQPQVQQQPRQPELPDPITDPEKFVEAVREMAVREAEAKLDARFRDRDDADYSARADDSEEAFAAKHGDVYHANKAAFVEELQARADAGDESLLKQLRQARNPAEFAFKIGSEILRYREIGNDPAAYEQRIIDRYLASQNGGQAPAPQAQARSATPVQTPQRQAPAVPRSMAGVSSAGPRSAGARPIGQRSLNELYDR